MISGATLFPSRAGATVLALEPSLPRLMTRHSSDIIGTPDLESVGWFYFAGKVLKPEFADGEAGASTKSPVVHVLR
jgi:hypothetical protein